MKSIKQFVAIPLMSASIVSRLMPNFGMSENLKSQISNVKFDISITLDAQSPIPIVSSVVKPVITPGRSRYQEDQDRLEKERQEQERQNQAKTKRSRELLPRDIGRDTAPSQDVKRALVKEIAAKKSIDWRILEAVWQVESGKSWDSKVASYAGARGPAQFLTSTFRKYGEDYNGDGVASIYSAEDSLAAAANLLSSAGLDRGDTRSALLSYNRANWYVAKVMRVADSIAE